MTIVATKSKGISGENRRKEMLKISNTVSISDSEIESSAIWAQGSGGQKVNKVSAAIHLRFDIAESSLPEFYKEKLLARKDKRITKEGIIVIKAHQHRSQEQNRDEAIQRLAQLIKSVNLVQKRRVETKPTKGSVKQRLNSKKKHAQKKSLRGKVDTE